MYVTAGALHVVPYDAYGDAVQEPPYVPATAPTADHDAAVCSEHAVCAALGDVPTAHVVHADAPTLEKVPGVHDTTAAAP